MTKAEMQEVKRLLRKVLKNQERLLADDEELLKEEQEVGEREERLAAATKRLRKAEHSQFSELEDIERSIKADVRKRPLSKVTSKDFTKAVVGAFLGVVGHFAFFYGTKIASELSMTRATILYIVSLALAVLFMYFTGFRRIDRRLWIYMPIRVITIYVTSLLVIVFVLTIFGFIDGQSDPSLIYRIVGSISIMAVLGASAADLIGRD